MEDTLAGVKEKIAALEDKLKNKIPGVGSILEEIRTILQGYPECVTLISGDEICTILAGLQHEKGIQLAVTASKKSRKESSASIVDKINLLGGLE